MNEDLRNCEVVWDGHKYGIVQEDLGTSCIVMDDSGGEHLISKQRIDSVTKLKND